MKVSIPVASHGLHNHKLNYPYLNTFNFTDLCPVFYEPLLKGEKIKSLKGGMFSRLNAVKVPAFATGRYVYKSFFVPFKYVYRPWYSFYEKVSYKFTDQTIAVPQNSPYIPNNELVNVFVDYCASSQGTLLPESLGYLVSTYDDADIVVLTNNDFPVHDEKLYKLTPLGTRVLKIFGSLGMSPVWNYADTHRIGLLPFLCYISVFLDHYLPRQYYNSTDAVTIRSFIKPEQPIYGYGDFSGIFNVASLWTRGFYTDGMFVDAFENPMGPNTNSLDGGIAVPDISNGYPFSSSSASSAVQVNFERVRQDPNLNTSTPYIESNTSSSSSSPSSVTNNLVYRLNQYLLDSLQSVALWAKRRQLSGGRLLERLMTSRGVKLDHDSVNEPFFLDRKEVEIDIDAVENNSDTNLGELAGKGVASTQNQPLVFNCSAPDDGIFMVICYVEPDSSMPIDFDQFNTRFQSFDFYHSEFDKLGAEAIPQNVALPYVKNTFNLVNSANAVFGFLNRYYGDVQPKPRLLGDFRFATRGAESLQAFHTFRLPDVLGNTDNSLYRHISLDYLSNGSDGGQYNRLFYSGSSDNLQMFIRWKIDMDKYKLPLGDSYDWDDDEANKRVQVVLNGNKN